MIDMYIIPINGITTSYNNNIIGNKNAIVIPIALLANMYYDGSEL